MTELFKLSLSAGQLVYEARKQTGINIDDEEAIEHLKALVKSFNEEARLHEHGAFRVQENLLRILRNRLYMKRDFKAHPEILDQKIDSPIFISGSVRTGSTKIHRMLAASGDFNWLPYWMALNPASYTGEPNEDTYPRIKDAEENVQVLHQNSPFARNVHDLQPHVPEEDTFVLMQSLISAGFMGYADVTGYLQRLSTMDMTKPYQHLRDTLKYLQWQGLTVPSRPWLLKSPFHCGMEKYLFEVFSDALLIVTHRHPTKFMASMCSMLKYYHMPYTSKPLNSSNLVNSLALGLRQHIAFRESNVDCPILDIDYSKLVESVEIVAKQVYEFCKLDLSQASLQRITNWNFQNPIHQKGKHAYTLGEFGLTEQQINEQNSDYINFIEGRFGV